MARTLVWSSEALDDIDAIARFIARDSVQHARKVVEALFDLGDSIGEQPMLGRAVPEWGRTDVRERFLYSYRVLYEVREEQTAILSVIHGRRLVESVVGRLGA